jgi:chromosome segregation ATPase
MEFVESAALSQEIEQLERELGDLRRRVDEDDSSFTTLEGQIDALRHRLTETRDTMRLRERELTEKKAALADVQRLERLEAYEQEVAKLREAAGRLSTSAEGYLSELDTYDGEVLMLRKLAKEMREVFGGDDQRVVAVETALSEQAQQLGGLWETVLGATKWRLREGDTVEAGSNGLSNDLQNRTEDGRAPLRILEYFTKS